MDFEAEIASEEQFWEELEDVVSTPCRTQERIDDTLRTWLALVSTFRESYATTEDSLRRCSLALLSSPLCTRNDGYIRRQLVEALLQEDDTTVLHLVVVFLIHDGRQKEEVYELLNDEKGFTRLISLIKEETDDESGLHRLLFELLYDMSRMQQVSMTDLMIVDDTFVVYMLQIVESLSNDVHDPYHDPIIKVLLVLNEQYMVNTHSSSEAGQVTNRVLKALCMHGHKFKTFGEDLIIMINRVTETSLQLLILKLLYLLCTTTGTFEYFYTNDLYVLTDILIRNLLDLPSAAVHQGAASLKYTYLRVLHPLLANTQLKNPPHYKKSEVRRALRILTTAGSHFDAPDDTTLRLAQRCLAIDWLQDHEDLDGVGEPESGAALLARRALGLGNVPEARESSLSVAEMAQQKEKPGVETPSRSRVGVGESPSSVNGE